MCLAVPPILKVRTVTVGVTLSRDSDSWPDAISRAAAFNAAAKQRLEDAGFEVQTTRIATNSFEEYVDASNSASAMAAFRSLDGVLVSHGAGNLFNAGPARSAEGVALIPEFIKLGPRISASGVVTPFETERAQQVARAILRIAAETERGEGNFQFCAAFNVPPGIPFFPAAYHEGEAPSFALGCETSELLAAALPPANGDLALAKRRLIQTFTEQMRPLEDLAHEISAEHGIAYGGIDASVAPNPSATPLTSSFESLGLGRFGDSGTLAACALVTSALKELELKITGYSGLMLPPLEDAGLAARANEGTYSIHDLLAYSAVCGLGLDTVPIPGHVEPAKLASLLLDASALAYRLQKPLTCRLFPVPGKRAGELTEFQNPYLCNAKIFDVP